MKRTIHTLCTAALLLAATACEDTLQTEGPAATGDGPTLTLRIDNEEEGAQTRTYLENADPTNNVRSVRILIFQGGTEADNYNNATYVSEETITEKEWPEETTRYEYTLKSAFVDGQTYTLLGVGMDNTFEDTYTIDEGTTLGQTYARLSNGKGKDNIATCEFFTGTVSFTHQGRSTQIDDLTMRRRVAGVMLYVTEIPQEVEGKRVTSVRLELGSNQKSSVLLKRDFTNPEWTEPRGQEELTGSQTLAQIDLSGYTYIEGQDFYMEEGKPATGYAGVYMLPLNLTKDQPTFTVRLYGKPLKAQDGTGTVDETAEETRLSQEFVVENRSESNANATAFDIRSNYIYCIGKKGEGIDDPISLSGEPIYLDVTEWTTISTNNPTFESARVQALFDDTDNPIHNCMNEEFSIKILPPLETIRNYVKTITLSIAGNSYSLDDKGQEVVENTQGDAGGRWLYIKNGTTYLGNLDITSQVKDNGGEVTLLMLDYAKPRQTWGWNIDNTGKQWNATAEQIDFINRDVRYTDVYLTTYMEWDKNGNSQIEDSEKITKTDVLTIKQYNTITVYYKGEDNDDEETEKYSLCGFSRKDYTEGATLTFGWGFWNSDNNLIYPLRADVPPYTGSYNTGAQNLNAIFDGTAWGSGWDGSAIQKSLYSFKKVNANGTLTEEPIVTDINDDNDKTNVGWCLPARYELEGFMIMCADRSQAGAAVEGNVPDNTPYWTSTTNGGATGEASIAYQIENKSGNRTYVYIESDRGNHDAYRIRQVRKFSDYYNGEW